MHWPAVQNILCKTLQNTIALWISTVSYDDDDDDIFAVQHSDLSLEFLLTFLVVLVQLRAAEAGKEVEGGRGT